VLLYLYSDGIVIMYFFWNLGFQTTYEFLIIRIIKYGNASFFGQTG
jgi:hypothetical protein